MSSPDPLEQAIEALRESVQSPPNGGSATQRAIDEAVRTGAPMAGAWKIPTVTATTLSAVGILTWALVQRPDFTAEPVPSDMPTQGPVQREHRTAPEPERVTPVSSQVIPDDMDLRRSERRGVVRRQSPDSLLGRAPNARAKDPSGRRRDEPLEETRAGAEKASPKARRKHAQPHTQARHQGLGARASRLRFREIHRLQFTAEPEQALAAWNEFLAQRPVGTYAVEARYHRAVILVRLGRNGEARSALRPFAKGDHGARRKVAAQRLLRALDAGQKSVEY